MFQTNSSICITPGEFPIDFLVSRLKGRRCRLPREWEKIAASTDPVNLLHGSPLYPFLTEFGKNGAWRFMRAEHRWVMARMNKRLITRFEYYFLYLQMHELFSCLRLRLHGGQQQRIEHRLHTGLLDKTTKTLLLSSVSNDELLLKLEEQSSLMAILLKDSAVTYRRHGLQTTEETVMDTFFLKLSTRRLHSVLKIFFSRLIDMRNLLILYKHIHLQMKKPPAFIGGGDVSTSLLEKAALDGDSSIIHRLLQTSEDRMAGGDLENALFSYMARSLKKNALEPTGTGFIILYFWEIFILATRMSEILSSVSFEPKAASGGRNQ